MTRVLDTADPARGEAAHEFQGHRRGAGISFTAIDASPRSGPKLHKHPHEEIFVIQEGTVTFAAGDEVVEFVVADRYYRS